MTNCCNLYPYCFFLSSFCVVRHVRLCFLNNFYCDILHRIQYCDSYVLSSVTSVNLKKAGMASRNIVLKKQYTLFWISLAVVFGLLVLTKYSLSCQKKIIIGGKRKKLQLKFVYYTFIATECYHDIATKRKFVNFFLRQWIPSQKYSEGGGTSVHRIDSDVNSLLLMLRLPLRCDGISNSITN